MSEEVPKEVLEAAKLAEARARVPRRYTFRVAETQDEFHRGSKFPGSFYDQFGTRLAVFGERHVEPMLAVLNADADGGPATCTVCGLAQERRHGPAYDCIVALRAVLAEARRQLEESRAEVAQWEEAEDQRAGDYCKRCDAGEPLRMRWGKYGEYVSHAPDGHTAGMGCYQERQHRLTALYEALRVVEARESEARRALLALVHYVEHHTVNGTPLDTELGISHEGACPPVCDLNAAEMWALVRAALPPQGREGEAR